MAKTRDIRTNQADISCDVCGRTLLRGEHPEAYLAGGERRQVCDLCTARAQHEGWIRESGADELGVRSPRHEGRGRGILDRLRGRREAPRYVQPETVAAPEPVSLEEPPAEPAHEPAPAPEPPQPAPRRRRRREAAPADAADDAALELAREPRHIRAVPTNAELKMRRALDVFNASTFTRTVGGVARSLGPPAVCVRPLPDRPSVVTITVMWELSWYRFEVDLSDEAGGVRRDWQGTELSELDPAEAAANAAADEGGRLHLGAESA